MLDIKENTPLKDHTTFRIGGPARYFVEIKNVEELKETVAFARDKNLPLLILGGGSNVLVSDEGFPGLVIHPKFMGFEIDGETVRFGSGELWDDVVKRCVEAGLWGIENLSFVPGDAGGFVIQNVGAYGQEARNVIDQVHVFDTITNVELQMSNYECKFGYRRSIFNTEERGRYVILNITIKLAKNGTPNTSYGIKADDLVGMREAIIAVRKSKGQDPQEYWSAGSFFKNVFMDSEAFQKLSSDIQAGAWDEAEGRHKIPAGFLLDKICNLKGLTVGGAKLSELQVINIINIGNATARDVLALFEKARDIVREQTGITLEHEPELVGF